MNNILWPLHTFTNKNIMAEIIPGYVTEQKVSAVLNDAATINDEITAQAADNWVVVSLTLSGPDMVILFTRTQPAS